MVNVQRLGQLETKVSQYGLSYDSIINWGFVNRGAEVLSSWILDAPSPGELVFEDTFNTATGDIDPANWTKVTGAGSGIDGGEQTYSADRVSVQGGKLALDLNVAGVDPSPTFVQSAVSAHNITTPKAVASSFFASVDDVIVAITETSNDQTSPAENYTWTNTGGSAGTWAKDTETNGAASGDIWMQSSHLQLTSAINLGTISLTRTAGQGEQFMGVLGHWSNTSGVGATARKTSTGTTNGSFTITTTQANSAVMVMFSDWNAVNGTARTYPTINGYTPTAGGPLELTYTRTVGQTTVYAAYYPDVGAAGAKTVSVNVGTGTPRILGVAVEIKGPDQSVRAGRVKSQYKVKAHYGRIEARIQLPAGGQGLWPAFWMMGDEDAEGLWPRNGEIDIMESINDMSSVYGSVHGPTVAAPGTQWQDETKYRPTGAPIKGYHLYALEWGPDALHWYFDDIKYKTLRRSDVNTAVNSWPFNDTFAYLILNVAYGGAMAGASNGTAVLPQQMLVDYVRIYERQSYPAANAKIDTLKLNFADDREIIVDGTVATVSGGTLNVTPTSSYYNGNTTRRFDLTNSSIYYNLAQLPNVGTGTISAFMKIDHVKKADGTTGAIEFGWNGSLYTHETIASAGDTNVAYNATNHKFMRVRHDSAASSIYFDTSLDAVTWSNFRTQAVSPYTDLTNVDVLWLAGYYGTEPTPGLAKFDNVNRGGATEYVTASDTMALEMVESSTIDDVTAVPAPLVPLDITHHNSAWNGTPAATKVTPSFTPPANAKLYVVGYAEVGTFAAFTMAASDSIGNTTGSGFTAVSDSTGFNAAAGKARLYVWELDTGSSPSARTVTITSSDASAVIAYNVFSVTGNSPHIKTGQVQSDFHVGNGGTGQVVVGDFPVAATSGNLVVMAVGANKDNAAAVLTPSGFTVLNATTRPGGEYETTGVFYRTNFTGVNATALNTDNLNNGFAGALFEIENSPQGGNDTGSIAVSESSSIAITVAKGGGVGTGAIAEYAFNENTGTTAAELNGGTPITGVPAWATGQTGSALSVIDTDGVFLDPFASSTNYTIMFDVYVHGNGFMAYNMLIYGTSSGDNIGTLQEINNALEYYPDITAVSSALPYTSWHHVAVTGDGTTWRLYVDGVQIGSDPTTAKSGTDGFRIGSQGGGMYKGNFKMDNLRIFNTALTQPQIAALAGTPVVSGQGGDTGSIAVSESSSVVPSGGSTPISGSESRSLAIAETSSIAKSSSTTDTGSVAIAETKSLDATSSRTDTGSIAIAESSSLVINTALPGTDTGSIAVSETSAVAVTLATTDTGSIAIAETTTTTNAFSASESRSLAIAETSSIANTQSTTDTGSIAISETSAVANTQASTDTGSIAVSESASIVVGPSTTDTGSIAVSETKTLAGSSTSTDTTAVSVDESVATTNSFSATQSNSLAVSETATPVVAFSTTDTGSIAVTETSSVACTMSSTDTGSLAVSEVAGIGSTLPGNESIAVSLSEQAILFLSQSVSDGLGIGVTEASAVAVTQASTDTGSLAVAETSQVDRASSTTDTGSLAVAETSSIAVSSSTTDTGSLAVAETTDSFRTIPTTDTASIAVNETSNANIVTAVPGTESIALGVTEQSSVAVTFSTTDTGSIAVTETQTSSSTLASTDTGSIAVTEVASTHKAFASTDTGSLAIAETSSVSGTVTASDTSALSVSDTGVVGYNPPGADTGSIAVSETVDLQISGGANISTADTGSLAISETAVNAVFITRTETIAVTASETAASAGTFTSTDTGSLAVAEASAPAVSSTRTDTGSLAVAETSSVAVTITTNESTAVSVSETQTSSSTLSSVETNTLIVTETAISAGTVGSTDSAAISVSESATVLYNPPGAETFALRVDETSDVQMAGSADKAGTDTGSLAVSETASNSVVLSRTDTAALAIAETSSVSGTTSATDTTAISIVETRSIASTLSRTDTSAITITESTSLAVTQSATDTAALAVSESIIVSPIALGADTAALGVTESSSIFITGTISKSASDTGSLAVSESATQAITLTRTDASALSVTETSEIAGTVTASDTLPLAVTESVTRPVFSDDTVTIGIIEQSTVIGNDAVRVVDTDDTLTVALNEKGRIFDPDAKPVPVRFASKSQTAIISSTTTESGTSVASSSSTEKKIVTTTERTKYVD